jgi:hypothetical protein
VHKFKLTLLNEGGPGRAQHFLPKSHSCFFHIERTWCCGLISLMIHTGDDSQVVGVVVV